ncbi:undecaprenyl-phosphate galactose phosphotransferase WbaP [Rubrobacter tropicus]|uniref:undecaprenyl-phosphate galactose phosphotransferase WbaP n=1 Tax=Rubrobacter tropicus TaxID=2653851 RepID=UPI00140CDAE0|nr:undecaprenyl-phosphate galactose phosphotransferase WbaP [Rubrobacter tropicus]
MQSIGIPAKPTSLAELHAGRLGESWRQHLNDLLLVLVDCALALAVWQLAILLRAFFMGGSVSEVTVVGVLPIVTVWVGLRALLGLYPGYGMNPVEELRRQTYAVLATLAITATFAVAVQVDDVVSRSVLAMGCAGLLLCAPVVRQLVKWRLMKLRLWGKPVVVFSSGETGGRVVALLAKEWGLGYKPIAVFGSHPGEDRRHYEAAPDDKSLADAMRLSRRYGVDTVIFAMPHTRREHLERLVHWASFGFRHVTVIPNLEGVANSAVVARDLAGVFGVEIRYNLLDTWVRRVKRALDLLATAAGGIFVVPLLLVLCMLVRLESGGPIFYTDTRLGRNGEPFSCLKFRTMIPDAEDALRRILERDPEARAEYARYHKLREDPRVTRVGRFLRRTSLDELPQLWNVLKGEMSLVGPRPYLPRESGDIGVTQSDILRVYPGMTGPWQVSGRSTTSFEDRVRMDAHYVRDWSVWLDLVLLARTVKALATDRSAF